MSRTFNSVGALANFLEGIANSLPQAQHAALDEASTFLLEKVKQIPGHYQDGWRQLSLTTQASRMLGGFPPNEPLLLTGVLRDSYNRHVDSPTRAEVGSNDDRAIWFEEGTKKMPPRPVLGAAKAKHDKDLVEIVGRRIQRHIGGRE